MHKIKSDQIDFRALAYINQKPEKTNKIWGQT